VTRLTARQSAAFPTVAILRKGVRRSREMAKKQWGRTSMIVSVLTGCRCRPGIKELFSALYKTDQPQALRAMIAFPNVWQAWSTTNEAYWGSSRFAQADNERYLSLTIHLPGNRSLYAESRLSRSFLARSWRSRTSRASCRLSDYDQLLVLICSYRTCRVFCNLSDQNKIFRRPDQPTP